MDNTGYQPWLTSSQAPTPVTRAVFQTLQAAIVCVCVRVCVCVCVYTQAKHTQAHAGQSLSLSLSFSLPRLPDPPGGHYVHVCVCIHTHMPSIRRRTPASISLSLSLSLSLPSSRPSRRNNSIIAVITAVMLLCYCAIVTPLCMCVRIHLCAGQSLSYSLVFQTLRAAMVAVMLLCVCVCVHRM